MVIFKVPFRHWPVFQHTLVAAFTVVATTVVGMGWLQRQEAELSLQRRSLGATQKELDQVKGSVPINPTEDFVKSLPKAQMAESVSRDIAAFGSTLNVQIFSISLEPHASTPTDLATVSFQVSARGEYPKIKAWIAELLGRYSTLAIKTLSVQALPNEPSKQDVRLDLVLYVRD
jgi:hypothetical protein